MRIRRQHARQREHQHEPPRAHHSTDIAPLFRSHWRRRLHDRWRQSFRDHSRSHRSVSRATSIRVTTHQRDHCHSYVVLHSAAQSCLASQSPWPPRGRGRGLTAAARAAYALAQNSAHATGNTAPHHEAGLRLLGCATCATLSSAARTFARSRPGVAVAGCAGDRSAVADRCASATA